MPHGQRQIQILIASNAPVAAVLWSTPDDATQLLRWDLRNDRIESGQWIRASIRDGLFDLSPNGKHLVGSFYRHTRAQTARAIEQYGLDTRLDNGGDWTAVSVLPYFRAIALWFDGDTRFGGGFWRSNTELELSRSPESEEAIAPPRGVKVDRLESPPGRDWVLQERLRRSGWESHLGDDGEVVRWEKRSGLVHLVWERSGFYESTFMILHRECWTAKHWQGLLLQPGWADIDPRGRILYAEKGCLYAWAEFPEGKPKRVADLNGNQFEAISPPRGYRGKF